MKKGMMISCKDATELVVKKSHEKLSGWDRFRLKFHLLMCKFCSLFEKHNAVIDSLAGQLNDDASEKLAETSREKILKELTA
jgi:hypothetical protein